MEVCLDCPSYSHCRRHWYSMKTARINLMQGGGILLIPHDLSINKMGGLDKSDEG